MLKNTEDTNVDFSVPVVMHVDSLDWTPSPSPTVWRRTLYREGGEPGPVTSFVRFTDSGRFAAHSHPEGEEIFVLDGVFSDENGNYPAGSFLLNPPGTSHTPGSSKGCLIFVHLRQYGGQGRLKTALNTNSQSWAPTANAHVLEKLLYAQKGFPERIALQEWHPGARVTLPASARQREILILKGSINEHRATTWLRFPASGDPLKLRSEAGALVYYREA